LTAVRPKILLALIARATGDRGFAEAKESGGRSPLSKAKGVLEPNNVRKIREGLLLSKAELARRAGISVLTLDRVEKGMNCRMDTKRKIILSLGLQLADRDKVFTNP
jgi:DNA-binding XRE family transcriptional regulator